MRIIGLCGKKQSGKNTFANFAREMLIPQGLKVKEIAIANPLKHFVMDYMGVPKKNCFGTDGDKNYPLSTWGRVFNESMLKKYSKAADDLLTGREILQVVGTDIFRNNFNSDFWINLCVRDMERVKDQFDVMLVTDVRFPNEIAGLKKVNADLVRIYRDVNLENSLSHASENAMDEIPDSDFNYVIYSEQNDSMKKLKASTTSVLINMGLLGGGVVVDL